MTSPIPSMPNFEWVECPPRVQAATMAEPCKHGAMEEWCGKCLEDNAARRRTERLRTELNNPKKPTLIERIARINGVPAKYLESDFMSFAGNDKLVSELDKWSGGSVVLFGNTGCGKTHLAVAMMKKSISAHIHAEIERNSSQPKSYEPRFKSAPELLLEIREAFRPGAEESEREIINRYCTADLLVLDDLGSEKTSEYSIATLYLIIDRRDRELMPTIITTNLSQKEIEEKLGARIASRLAGMRNYKINMPDYRKKRGA